MRKVCEKCGKTAGKTARFCAACGFHFPLEETELIPETPAVLSEDTIEDLELGMPAIEGEAEHGSAPCSTLAELPSEPDVEERPAKSIHEATQRMYLSVVAGGHAGLRFECLAGMPLIMGASSRADIRLHEDEYVSGVHASVQAEPGAVVIEDCGSSNGLYVKVKSRQRLAPGDEFLLGRTLLRIEQG